MGLLLGILDLLVGTVFGLLLVRAHDERSGIVWTIGTMTALYILSGLWLLLF